MEQVNYCQTSGLHVISEELYNRFDRLGLIPNEVRDSNVGKSDYSKHTIQPWSIWIDYELNPWDADIVKRILRTKEEPGMSAVEARIMDYDKIEHICRERKRQLKSSKEPSNTFEYIKDNYIIDPTPITYDPQVLKWLAEIDSKPKLMEVSTSDTSASTLDVESYPSDIISKEVEKFTLSDYKPEPTINYSLNEEQVKKYSKFVDDHKKCLGHIRTIFDHSSGIGITVKVQCSKCKEVLDITDVSKW